jgi:hypothetical protein
VITGKDNIEFARIMVLRQALNLEIMGMKRHGRSAYAIIKEEFGFRGSRQSVLIKLNRVITEMQKERDRGISGNNQSA